MPNNVDEIYAINISLQPTTYTLYWQSTQGRITAMGPPITAYMDFGQGAGYKHYLLIAGLDHADEIIPPPDGPITSQLILCLDPDDGHEMWSIKNAGTLDKPRGWPLNPLEIYDVNGDGIPELFTCWAVLSERYGYGMACLKNINTSTPTILWEKYEQLTDPIGCYTPVWHHFCIIANKQTNHPYVYFNGGAYGYNPQGDLYQASVNKVNAVTGNIVTRVEPAALSCDGGLSAADIDNDGKVEIILGAHSSLTHPTTCYTPGLVTKWYADTATYSSTQCPALLDVNNDGLLEVVSVRQTSPAGLNVLDPLNGQQIEGWWTTSLGTGVSSHEMPSYYDVDGDGYYEGTTCYSSPVHVFKIASPPQLLGQLQGTTNISNPPNFVNLQGTSQLEIATAGGIWTGIPPYNRLTTQYFIGRPHVNDIDGDGYLEVFGSGIQNQWRVICYKTNVPAIPGLNTMTAMQGYRRTNSPMVYEQCPGTYWYTWEQYNQQHPQ